MIKCVNLVLSADKFTRKMGFNDNIEGLCLSLCDLYVVEVISLIYLTMHGMSVKHS